MLDVASHKKSIVHAHLDFIENNVIRIREHLSLYFRALSIDTKITASSENNEETTTFVSMTA